MKHLIISISIYLTSLASNSQELVILKGVFADSVLSITSRYLKQEGLPNKYPFIIIETGENTEVYWGFVGSMDKYDFLNINYYCLDSEDKPIFIYHRLENLLEFTNKGKERSDSIARSYLLPNGQIDSFHYRQWYAKFKGNTLVEFKRNLPIKKEQHVLDIRESYH